MTIDFTWKRAAAVLAAAALLLGGTFYAGKRTRPAELEQHVQQDTHSEFHLVDNTVTQGSFKVDMSKLTNAKTKTHTERKIRESIDGTKETTEVTDITTDTSVAETKGESIDLTIHNDVKQDAKVDDHKTVDLKIKNDIQPNWAVGVEIEASIGHFTLDDLTKPTIGVFVERRILGPVWVGASINTEQTVRGYASARF